MSLLYKEAFTYGLDIFADASITKREIVLPNGERSNYYVSCAGTAAIRRENNNDSIIPITLNENYTIYHDCTNNMGELLAILNAVRLGHNLLSLTGATHINIISDSKISIFGLKDWIFNWIFNIKDGIMYGSSGPVLNQRIIIQIIYEIIQNNDMIRFYHIRGHQKSSNVPIFMQSFFKENGFTIDNKLANYLIKCNDRVDTMSREQLTEENILATEPMYLKESILAKIQYELKPVFNMENLLMNLDINKYKYLIGRN